MKKIILVTTLVIMVSLLVVVPAFAAPQNAPLGRCKPGYTMVKITNNPSIPTSTDVNGDGFVCVRARPNTGSFLVLDNFIKIRCHPAVFPRRSGR